MRGTTSTTMFEWTGGGAEDEECALVGYCESLNLHIRTPSTTCPCSMCATTPFIYGNRTQHSRLDCRHSQPATCDASTVCICYIPPISMVGTVHGGAQLARRGDREGDLVVVRSLVLRVFGCGAIDRSSAPQSLG